MLKKVNSLPNMARVISSTNSTNLAHATNVAKTTKPSFFITQSPRATPKFGFAAALQNKFDEKYGLDDKAEKAFVGLP